MLELFFDLVFVFTVTQLTSVVRHADGAAGYLHAAGILLLTWWMYDGYAWLSNNVGPTTLSTQLPMLVGMTGLLVMAIATPDAFGSARWAFASAYLVVIAVHALQFARSSQGGSARAVLAILPVNASLPVLLILAAALGPDRAGWIGWALAVAVLVASVVTSREYGFTLRADHFAERHQLVVIIALGETVVATGAGAQGRLESAPVLLAVLASMALLAGLWFAYFAGDAERTTDALNEVADARRATVALRAYGLGHLLHVAGLVLLAAGLHDVVAHPGGELGLRLGSTMAIGCAVFLFAQALFVHSLGLGWTVELMIGGLGALAGAALSGVSAVTELAALVAVVLAVVIVRGLRATEPA